MEQGTTTMARARNEPLAMGAVKSSTRCQTAPGASSCGVSPNSRSQHLLPGGGDDGVQFQVRPAGEIGQQFPGVDHAGRPGDGDDVAIHLASLRLGVFA